MCACKGYGEHVLLLCYYYYGVMYHMQLPTHFIAAIQRPQSLNLKLTIGKQLFFFCNCLKQNVVD